MPREYVRQSQQILRDNGIHPCFSRKNLLWGPNFSRRNDEYAKDTLSRLRVPANNGQLADELKATGIDFKAGVWDVE